MNTIACNYMKCTMVYEVLSDKHFACLFKSSQKKPKLQYTWHTKRWKRIDQGTYQGRY